MSQIQQHGFQSKIKDSEKELYLEKASSKCKSLTASKRHKENSRKAGQLPGELCERQK